jgi:hypothetical protein
MKDPSNIVAGDLSTPERILLFCLASGTEWAQAGVTGAMVTAMIVRGLIDRDSAARLVARCSMRCWATKRCLRVPGMVISRSR